ncbi:MAG: phosphoserine phosphatase RsbU/P [Verrucomicrobiota bacterium]|jgi:PAS domain S-box-containing protein
MKTPLHVLIIEDSEFDAQMMVSHLRKAGYDVLSRRVETALAMREALKAECWQLVLADYNLPTFSAPDALKLLQSTGLDLPFIIVSGGIGEDIAVASMKAGAHDYLMKGSLSRLAPAVERELREAANRAGQRESRHEMIESERRYRLLWETCPDAVILMNTDGKILFANPAVYDVFGHTPDELTGENLDLLQPESLTGPHAAGLEGCLRSGRRRPGSGAIETTGRRRDGVEFPIEVSFSDMELDGQRRFVGFIRDITARKRAERELRDNQEQFAVAREIQQRLFPKAAPACPGFDVAGASFPAEATGGDYFDFLPMLHDRVGLVVSDVAGHGVGPALLMAETRAYLRVLAGRREDVGEILTRANSILAEDMGGERYITLFLGRLDSSSRELVYASAGHPPGFVLSADGSVRTELRRTGIPLGMRASTNYSPAEPVILASGELLVLLTDGIEEASSPSGDLFGTERALDVVRIHREKPARAIVEALYNATREFAKGAAQLDDITAIVVKTL